MWKEYSTGYIKNNRASGISVMTAAFISALLLSLLCSISYNLWVYEIERIKAQEGDWQARITGEISGSDLALMQNDANVKSIVINEGLSDEKEIVADVYVKNMRNIFTDMPEIAELAGFPAESVIYHYELLNMYLIRDTKDPALRWVFPFFLAVVLAACLSLVLVIHNAFAVTMNARVHQFGIFASIGATPRQIRICLLQEAFTLCAVPIVTGILLGILISMGIISGINLLLADVEGRIALPFAYHPVILLLSCLTAVLTIWISAWVPARRLSKLTPLEAIKSTGELQLRKKKESRILSRLFGIEGELAGNALKAQKKALRTANISLLCSFLAFSFMMCFITLTIVSQRETYFERYQDAWDVMITIKDTEIVSFTETDTLQFLPGSGNCVVYQKAMAKRVVTQDEISEEMRKKGGFSCAPGEYVSAYGDAWLVNAPILIMDDAGFLEYCSQIGAEPRLDGAVILNKTLDAANPNFRKRQELPYLTGNAPVTTLRQAGQEEITAKVPVLAYTKEVPALREEYGTLDFYELVHFIPVSEWKEIKDRIGGSEDDLYIRILAPDGAALETLNEIEDEAERLLGQTYEIELENRIQERADNDKMMSGMKAILSLFCILLAAIGIGNVFSNTLGFVNQRKREFARLLSVGMTPGEMKKIFCVEALVIAGRPVLFAIPVTGSAVAAFLKMSYLEPMLFIREAPFIPILVFILVIFGFVALAYYLGAKKVLRSNLADSLRDDTVM